MEQQSNRLQLIEWMREIVPYNNLDKYLREKPEREPGHFGFILATDLHWYSIYGYENTEKKLDGHLGCIGHCRKTRAGEDWLRGSDLPDGPFSRATWEAIKDAILRYEFVKLEPIHEAIPVAEAPGLPTDSVASPVA